MVSLIQLDRAAVRVGYHDAAAPLAVLMILENRGAERFQCRRGRLKRGDPQTDEGAAGGTPPGGATRSGSGEHGDVHVAHLARGVDETIAVILVVQREAQSAVERHRLLQMLGKNDDRCQLRHTGIVP